MNISHFNDQQLTAFIDQMFNHYDRNSDGYIQAPQFALFFNDLYASLGMQVQITFPIAQAAIKQIDANGDGKLSRVQLFVAFKYLIVNNQNQQNYAIMNYPAQYNSQAYQ